MFVGSYVSKAAANGDIVLDACCGILENGTVTIQKDCSENVFYSLQNCLVVADNSPIVFGDTDGVVEYWDVRSKSRSSFRFTSDNESRCTVVSPDLGYIASQDISRDGESVTYKISDRAQIFQKTYKSSGTVGIDFCESAGIAAIVNGKDFDVVKLT